MTARFPIPVPVAAFYARKQTKMTGKSRTVRPSKVTVMP
jgi:hypothetical protein